MARFCRSCGQSLRGQTRLRQELAFPQKLWDAPVKLRLDWPLWVDGPLLVAFTAEEQLAFLHRPSGTLVELSPALPGLVQGFLADFLFLGFLPDRLEVIHLTPYLTGDPCRVRRGSRRPLSHLPDLPAACSQEGDRLAWFSDGKLHSFHILAGGLVPAWQRPWGEACQQMLWHKKDLWLVEAQALSQLAGDSGHLIKRWPLPFACLEAVDCEGILVVGGQQGEVWLLRNPDEDIWLLPASPSRAYALAADRQRAIFSRGRTLLAADLESGRSWDLELPLSCTLPARLTPQQALITSANGTLLQVQFHGGRPSLGWSFRPFSSLEPNLHAPLLEDGMLLWASPEGQLSAWNLGSTGRFPGLEIDQQDIPMTTYPALDRSGTVPGAPGKEDGVPTPQLQPVEERPV